jgi:predicted Zn-dependent protease
VATASTVALALGVSELSLVGCEAVDQTLASAADAFERQGDTRTANLLRAGRHTLRGFRDVTIDQEHYIGRSVSAEVLANPKFKLSTDRRMQNYVSSVGQAVALGAADVRATYQGYRFVLLDSPTINAFASPGGYVFITEGAVRAATSEEELAGVLAHEIGHVHAKHGLQAIKNSNFAEATKIGLGEVLKGEKVEQMNKVFGDSIQNVVVSAVENGYSQEQENEADELGAKFAKQAGYSYRGLISYLERADFDGGGFKDDHPSAADRVSALTSETKSWEDAPADAVEVRTKRFRKAVGS